MNSHFWDKSFLYIPTYDFGSHHLAVCNFICILHMHVFTQKEITHPEEGVKGTVLHELCYNHDRTALCDHALQADNVWVVKLAHD